MTSYSRLFLFVPGVFCTVALYAISDFSTKKLSSSEAISKWGSQKFESNTFKSGDNLIRAKMASDLLENNQFRGKSVLEVWEALGHHDGHYKNDVVPAYILNDDENDVWQLVFLVDEKRFVTSMAIYKNCCEK